MNKDAPSNKKLLPLILKTRKQFTEKMDNDFNSTEAFAALYELIREANSIGAGKEAAAFMEEVDTFLGLLEKDEMQLTKEQQELIELRETARKKGEWKEADRIRAVFLSKGIMIEDNAGGTRIRKV